MVRSNGLTIAGQLILVILIMIIAGCTVGAPVDPGPDALFGEGLPALPLDLPRGVSVPYESVWEGNDYFDRGGYVNTFSATHIRLGNDFYSVSYAMFRLGTGGNSVISGVVDCETEQGEIWIARSNYDENRWDILGPFSSHDGSLDLPESSISPADNIYLVFIAMKDNVGVVNSITMTVNRPGWNIHTVDTNLQSGYGISMFVQDGKPMIGYSRAGTTMRFARSTKTLPTATEDWVSMVVDSRSSPAKLGAPLAAASIAGKPAMVYMESDEDLLVYSRSDAAEPVDTANWHTHELYDMLPTYATRQLGLVECVGTPRISFKHGMPSKPYLATTATSQPGPTDWSIVNIIGGDDEGRLTNLTEYNDHPIMVMDGTIGEFNGLFVAFAATHTPPLPSAWDVVPVYSHYEGVAYTSIAIQMVGESVRPIVSYCQRYWGGRLMFSQALVDDPSQPTDWRTIYLPDDADATSITVADGRPFIAYCETDGAVKTAWASVPEPTTSEDFFIDTIVACETSDYMPVAAAAVGDTPVIAFYDANDQLLKFAYYGE